jgi:hypothetical protein
LIFLVEHFIFFGFNKIILNNLFLLLNYHPSTFDALLFTRCNSEILSHQGSGSPQRTHPLLINIFCFAPYHRSLDEDIFC